MQELFKDSDNFELALTGKALKLLFVGKKVEVRSFVISHLLS